ncbi:hypothetical protein P885DRAFT_61848 [Corynascus similis CBS 632.67]
MSGSASSSPGSSPPEWTQQPFVTWQYRNPPWQKEDIYRQATYTNQGVATWRVNWEEALVFGEQFYDQLRQNPDVDATLTTSHGARLVAVLVASYMDNTINQERSMIFMSTIPRGAARRRLEGPTGGHDTWRGHCYRNEVFNPAQHCWPSEVHAEDNVINLFLNVIDHYMSPQGILDELELQWLGGNFMVVYGLRAFNRRFRPRSPRIPRQALPCGPWSREDPSNKLPKCQTILDRMLIEWRFGIASDYEPSTVEGVEPYGPDQQLPRDPYGGGNGQGGGSSGGDNPASGYHTSENWGLTDISFPSSSGAGGNYATHQLNAAKAAKAYIRQVRKWTADAKKTEVTRDTLAVARHRAIRTGPVSCAEPSPFIAQKPPRRDGPPVCILPYLRIAHVNKNKRSLSDTFAKLSLDNTKTQTNTQHTVKQVTRTARLQHGIGAGGAHAHTHANGKKPAAPVRAVGSDSSSRSAATPISVSRHQADTVSSAAARRGNDANVQRQSVHPQYGQTQQTQRVRKTQKIQTIQSAHLSPTCRPGSGGGRQCCDPK